MFRRSLLLGLAGSAFLGLSGCATRKAETVYQPTEMPKNQLRDCIRLATGRIGWRIMEEKPGFMKIRYVKQGEHVLNAEIKYDDNGFEIVPIAEGSTLIDDDGTPHRKVNQWIWRLAKVILKEQDRLVAREIRKRQADI